MGSGANTLITALEGTRSSDQILRTATQSPQNSCIVYLYMYNLIQHARCAWGMLMATYAAALHFFIEKYGDVGFDFDPLGL